MRRVDPVGFEPIKMTGSFSIRGFSHRGMNLFLSPLAFSQSAIVRRRERVKRPSTHRRFDLLSSASKYAPKPTAQNIVGYNIILSMPPTPNPK